VQPTLSSTATSSAISRCATLSAARPREHTRSVPLEQLWKSAHGIEQIRDVNASTVLSLQRTAACKS